MYTALGKFILQEPSLVLITLPDLCNKVFWQIIFFSAPFLARRILLTTQGYDGFFQKICFFLKCFWIRQPAFSIRQANLCREVSKCLQRSGALTRAKRSRFPNSYIHNYRSPMQNIKHALLLTKTADPSREALSRMARFTYIARPHTSTIISPKGCIYQGN